MVLGELQMENSLFVGLPSRRAAFGRAENHGRGCHWLAVLGDHSGHIGQGNAASTETALARQQQQANTCHRPGMNSTHRNDPFLEVADFTLRDGLQIPIWTAIGVFPLGLRCPASTNLEDSPASVALPNGKNSRSRRQSEFEDGLLAGRNLANGEVAQDSILAASF